MIGCFNINMNGVSNNAPINYTSADVGVLNPPDKLGRWKLTDAELENKFKTLDKDVYAHQKHYSFEDKKQTPTLVKFLFGGGLILLLWQGIKIAIKK